MKKITQFYLNKASYIAIDEDGNQFNLDVDYWNNESIVSEHNKELEKYAQKLLQKKHRVNYVYKMHDE